MELVSGPAEVGEGLPETDEEEADDVEVTAFDAPGEEANKLLEVIYRSRPTCWNEIRVQRHQILPQCQWTPL